MDKKFYIKSYSKGQFTLPKEVRDHLKLGDDFWLELIVEGDHLVLKKTEVTNRLREPVSSEYIADLKKIDGTWALDEDFEKIRQNFDSRNTQNDW